METEHRTQKIAVTGATGRVGSQLVEVLEQRGHDVVPIARSKGVDVISGEGLQEPLAGVETIIDTAPMSMPFVAWNSRCDAMRVSSTSIIRAHTARGGTSMSRSRSTAMENTSSFDSGAR